MAVGDSDILDTVDQPSLKTPPLLGEWMSPSSGRKGRGKPPPFGPLEKVRFYHWANDTE
jgi:hypothetical protein